MESIHSNRETRLIYKSIVKPFFDRLFALILLITFFPLFLIVAILIKLDSPGPALFIQKRVGERGKLFSIYKFRSMVVNNSDSYTSSNDPRITKMGAFIRKASIDELPQLLNVLKGEMSLIGPRPSLEREEEMYGKENFYKRHLIKPGITGLHQSLYRSSGSLRSKILLDTFYVRKISFMLDLKILFWTFKIVLGRGGGN